MHIFPKLGQSKWWILPWILAVLLPVSVQQACLGGPTPVYSSTQYSGQLWMSEPQWAKKQRAPRLKRTKSKTTRSAQQAEAGNGTGSQAGSGTGSQVRNESGSGAGAGTGNETTNTTLTDKPSPTE